MEWVSGQIVTVGGGVSRPTPGAGASSPATLGADCHTSTAPPVFPRKVPPLRMPALAPRRLRLLRAGGPATLVLSVTLLVLTSLAVPAGAAAYQAGTAGPAGAGTDSAAVLRADSLYFAGAPEASWSLLQERLDGDPDDVDALWRATRAALVLGIMEDGGIAAQNVWLDRGVETGSRAVDLRPDGVDALYWSAAVSGRRALNAGPRYAADLAQRAYDQAHAVLALDSLHGGAYDVLGKIQYEVMRLSRIQRLFARLLVGNDALRRASWGGAEKDFRRAVALWPDVVLFRLDLGELLVRRGRKDEARSVLRDALALPDLHPPDPRFKARARALLDGLGA